MSLTLVKFLYKAADSRNADMATYGGIGAAGGAGIAGLLNKDDDIKSKLIAMGLGGAAGGALGIGYGINKDPINRTVKNVFTDTHESNPLMTGLGLGTLSAGAVGAHDYVTGTQGLSGPEAAATYGVNTLKSHPAGGALSDPGVSNILGEKVDPIKKQEFMARLAAKEDQLTAQILAGGKVPGVNPVRFQAIRAFNMMGMKDKAELVARREAVRTILDDDAYVEGLKNELTPIKPPAQADVDALATTKRNLQTAQASSPSSARVEEAVRELARQTRNPRNPPSRELLGALKERVNSQKSLHDIATKRHSTGIDAMKSEIERLTEIVKKEQPILDTKSFGKSIMENIGKVKTPAWKRLGTVGLGAGALGTIAASLENKLYD